MPTSRLFLALLVAVGLVIPSNGFAAVLCKKKSGVIAVRDACKGKETRLDPDSLGLRGTKGDKGDPGQSVQGPPGPEGPGVVVKDANGTLVGVVEQFTSPLFVARRIGSYTVHLQIDDTCVSSPSGSCVVGASFGLLTAGGGVPLWYASSDCSGPPLKDAKPTAYDDVVGVTPSLAHGGIVYPAGSGSMVTLNSDEQRPDISFANQAACDANCGSGTTVFGPPDRCCQTLGSSDDRFVASVATIDPQGTALGLVPPFRLDGP